MSTQVPTGEFGSWYDKEGWRLVRDLMGSPARCGGISRREDAVKEFAREVWETARDEMADREAARDELDEERLGDVRSALDKACGDVLDKFEEKYPKQAKALRLLENWLETLKNEVTKAAGKTPPK